MKKKILVVFIIIIALLVGCVAYYKSNLKAVSSNSEEVEFMVDSGSTYYSVISKLAKEKLIRSELCFKIYIKLNKVNKIEAGTYKLNRNMSVKDIVEVFSKGNTYNPDAIVITFKEGKNMRAVARTIAEYTDNREDSVYTLLKDTEYLKKLIEKYWFLTDEILNKNIYYSLEGYLYPNTYEFKNKSVTVKEIFETLLDETDKKLTPYKDDLLNNKYTIHELITLASIVELEGGNSDDREGVAAVFYNRLNAGWALGSDVTTYYAIKVDMNERDLYSSEINDQNYYNTRSNFLAGKLPVGPICSPSVNSIKAVLYPKKSEYYYFVADKNGKTYFSKTYEEHKQIRSDLIEAGLWYTYE